MVRRVWIIPSDIEINQNVISDAISNNCPEIAKGIPSILKDEISMDNLPCVYEESVPIETEIVKDLSAEITKLVSRIENLEKLAKIVK